jgi:primosomal protein N' (replication factor Y)
VTAETDGGTAASSAPARIAAADAETGQASTRRAPEAASESGVEEPAHDGESPASAGGGRKPATMESADDPASAESPDKRVRGRGKSSRRDRRPASTLPVARVCVDVSLPHLDRPFDYLVPADADDAAQPGVRVRIRFAGQLLDGVVLERVAESEHTGSLAYLERVVSPVRVVTGEVATLARAVADRYAGTLADVLRLAVPPRHARAETAALNRRRTVSDRALSSENAASDRAMMPANSAPDRAVPEPAHVPAADRATAAGWAAYPSGSAFLRALRAGRAPRAVWTALPGEDWPARIADAVAAARQHGLGVLVVVADARDLDRVDAALDRSCADVGEASGRDVGRATTGTNGHITLSAAVGPEQRYARFLRALDGEVHVVAGTRAAAFAPVDRLGLVVIWDDGDDLHAEPRAPYPHAREILLTRAHLTGAAVLVGAFARTAEAQQLVETGWAKEIVADRGTVRSRSPLVTAVADDDPQTAAARLPTVAWQAARDALAADAPVLVQVPRRGYLPAVTCATCRAPVRCTHCNGPLALPGASASAVCRWCGRIATDWRCVHCGGTRMRAAVVGARRTAEELGRAFADVPVRTSGRDSVLSTVPDEASLVVATPGAEPLVSGQGYGAVLLLDTWALLTRADLRAGEETLRRWLAAAALARPADVGGRVVVVADGGLAPVQALIRFDPAWLAARDLDERRTLGFPPAVRMASLSGSAAAVADLLDAARLPAAAELLGPVPAADHEERYLVRVPRGDGLRLAHALHAATGVRSARKSPEAVRVQIDPHELL